MRAFVFTNCLSTWQSSHHRHTACSMVAMAATAALLGLPLAPPHSVRTRYSSDHCRIQPHLYALPNTSLRSKSLSICCNEKRATGFKLQARCSSADEQKDTAAPCKQQRSGAGLTKWQWLGLSGLIGLTLLVYMVLKRTPFLDVWTSTQLGQSSGTGSSFTVNVFGKIISLGERSPGWFYFMLLMAAGFGLFVSEEALNVWVGASLARCLTWNGTREAFFASVSGNMGYIASTILWVYWGVCISDMVPFYAGKLAAQSKPGERVREKLGIDKHKLDRIGRAVQRYGNFIGFVERFSIGARNPTSFLAGASGVSASKFFAGVCMGGLITLPIQMSVGFMLRERPVAALAGVAAFVGIWTIFPYLLAALASLFYFTRRPDALGS